MSHRIGVLALQGDFAKHLCCLKRLGVAAQEVRSPQDLDICDGLIIPGGESTAIFKQMEFMNLREPLLSFAKRCPIFGTCAGLIVISCRVPDFSFTPLQLLDVTVKRNGFGRQVDSFRSDLALELGTSQTQTISAFFIRAPRIIDWGKEVQVLSWLDKEPVLVRQGHFLGASFHSEIGSDLTLHDYFVKMTK